MDESSVFGLILRVLFEELFQGLGRWLAEFLWVDEDALVKKLKTTILSVEAMLNCSIQKHIANPIVHEWLNELEDAVYDARILLDEVCAGSSHGKLGSRAKRNEIKRALDKLEYMAGQKDVLGLRDLEIRSTATSFFQESHVYGRNDDMEAITRLLMLSYDESSDITTVVAIVGDAGIGKTTVAQLVINNKRVQEQFDFKVWVCVSNGFDAYSVSKAILEAVTMSTCDTRELSVLQIRLRDELSGKSLLLVLDDVKDENCTEWEIIKGPLRFCSEESKIIVTTCDENIAAMMRTLPAYHLSRLSFKDCWSIFARYAFHGGRFIADPELKEVGRGIVKKCKGHPLAAKTIGNLLRYQPNRERWDAILKDESWDSSHDIISIIQNLSLKSGRSRWKEGIAGKNGEKYASMKLTKSRHQSTATTRDTVIPVPPMYKAIRSKKAWLPKLLILWIIVWSTLSLAVFTVTNSHIKIEREKVHCRMCIQGARALENEIKTYSDRMYGLAIPMLQLFINNQHVCTEVKMNKTLSGYMGPFLVASEECEQRLLPPGRILLSELWGIPEKKQAHFLKATALGKAEFFHATKVGSNYSSTLLMYPVHTSAHHPSSSSSSQQSMRPLVRYIGVELKLKCFVERIFGFDHTDGSQTIWVNVHLMSNSSTLSSHESNSSCIQAYGQHHFEINEPILYTHKFTHEEQGWSSIIICGHHKKLPLPWTTITITVLFFICGMSLGYMIYIIANSILITGEASFTIQELHAHTEAIDAATSQQLAAASQKITTPAHSILETLALLLNTELSPTQKGYTKLAHTCTRNLITTAKDVLRRSH